MCNATNDQLGRIGSSKKYNTGLVCPVPGCEVKTDFKRNFELQRHMQKHQRDVAFNCPVIHCHRQGSHAFYREDKLKAHLRAAHNDDDMAKCPCSHCPSPPILTLDLLAIHAATHLWDPHSRAIATYAKDTRKCPMPKCRRWTPAATLPAHLHTHHAEPTRLAHAPLLAARSLDARTCTPLCPCCRAPCATAASLRLHIEAAHCADAVLSAAHLALYAAAVRARIAALPWYVAGAHADWAAWAPLPLEMRSAGFACPGCAIVFDPASCWAADGHASVVGAAPELWAWRREVLWLLPEFASHPVFEDVRRGG
ncbi:membrane transporter [Neofusicoccum parvum]|nr:membrane transporter [Neofusicoccum parvum]